MKILKTTFAVIALLTISACTINKPQEKERTITVNGSGTVTVNADELWLTFPIRNTEWVINTAITNNATITDRAIAAIRETGIDANDIKTFDYKITEENYWANGREYAGRYTVSNKIKVLVRNPNSTGAVIDAAIKSGTLALENYERTIGDTSSAIRQARTLAVQNAQDAASLVAGASGCKVNQVMSITENLSSNLVSKSDSVPAIEKIEADTVSITSNVQITYSIIE